MMPALFVDRDGVLLHVEKGKYVLSPEEIEWIPGSIEALVSIATYIVDVIVISNQQCVNKGLLKAEVLAEISEQVRRDCLYAISGFYYCPHLEAENCPCRKPKIGLFTQAMRERYIDPRKSLMVGDTDGDILAAQMAGVHAIFVRSGHQPDTTLKVEKFDNLLDAVPFIQKFFQKGFDE